MQEKISFIIVNNLGGITSMIQNLIQYRGDTAFEQELILLDVAGNTNMHPAQIKEVDGLSIKRFSLHPRHNWYVEYGRLANLLDRGHGVLVSNDQYDLIMLTHFNVPRKVVQIVHDGYNVRLSILFEEVVDAFVCHSFFFYEALCQLLPHRRNDIHHIPYGIPLRSLPRKSRLHHGRLKLAFLGRHDRNKGIFDLYAIHQELMKRNVPVDWLILGKGPETEAVKQQWQTEQHIRFETPPDVEQVLDLLSDRDILVFPTKFEGFPVALIEAMSVGCVPVVSDLPGGIREVVKPGTTGYLCPLDQHSMFADHIEQLHHDRSQLERMSEQAYLTAIQGFDARSQSPRYHTLFNSIAASEGQPRHHSVRRKIGSRLDQPWIPNSFVKYLRKANK